jgi:hypothetical protein
MGRMPRARHLWPGLPQMCSNGGWSALVVAVGFAALLNLALMASLWWSELFSAGVRSLLWLAVVAIWVSSAVFSYRRDRRHLTPPAPDPAEDAFQEALDHYLKGNWFEAEHFLRGLLARDARDLDAGLMLATLLRRTGRPDEAARELDRLERLDGSQKWELEIGRERELLAGADIEGASGWGADPEHAAADPPTEMPDAA